jgi:hypothetical protein
LIRARISEAFHDRENFGQPQAKACELLGNRHSEKAEVAALLPAFGIKFNVSIRPNHISVLAKRRTAEFDGGPLQFFLSVG